MEVDLNDEAADFASKSHSMSLPKSTQIQEHPCAVGGKCRAAPQGLRERQGAAVSAVGCG